MVGKVPMQMPMVFVQVPMQPQQQVVPMMQKGREKLLAATVENFLLSVCVCVNHLNRCKTSTFRRCFSIFIFQFSLFMSVNFTYNKDVQQGDVAYNQGPRPTKLPDCMGYRA